MSTIEVDKVIPQSGTALQVGEASDTINVPSGATLNINSGATITNNGTASGFDTDTNDKVKVSTNDTTPGFLNGKLVAGTNISLTEGSDGGDETLTAAFSGNLNASVINAGTIATARLGSGTADATTFLRGDQTYAAAGGTNTPAFLANLTANQTIANATYTKVQLNNKVLDTNNNYDNSTNYRFTPTTAGYYWLSASGRFDGGGGNTPHRHIIRKNNIAVSQIQTVWSNATATQYIVSGIHYANGSSDYFEYFVRQDTGSNHIFNGGTWDTGAEIARFGGYKIIT